MSRLLPACLALPALLSACSQDWDVPRDAGSDTHPEGSVDAQLDPVLPDTGAEAGARDGELENSVDGQLPATPCGSSACQHGGTCTLSGGVGSCNCPPEWTGSECETDVDECQGAHGCPASSPCQNLSGGYTCAGLHADFPLPRRTASSNPAAWGWDVSDDMVVDNQTGLAWHRATSASAVTSAQVAREYCSASRVGGFSDWRLPSWLEVLTLVHGEHMRTELPYQVVFPDWRNLWLSTLIPQTTRVGVYTAWDSEYWDYDGMTSKPDVFVRCVRTAQVKCVLPPSKRISIDASAGLARDLCTQLTWHNAPDATLRSYEEAEQYCAALNVAGRSFRVPTFLELYSLIDLTRTPSYPAGFNVPSGYVTSSTKAPHPPNADALAAGLNWSREAVDQLGYTQWTEYLPEPHEFKSLVRCVSDGT